MKSDMAQIRNPGGARWEEALRVVRLGEGATGALESPADVHRFVIPLQRDDGSCRRLTGWRIRYSDSLGPTKGGVRFNAATSEEDLTALAFRLLLKCAVNGLPHGGAAGGVAVDARDLSPEEHERLARSYVDAVVDTIGPERDILSPDLGTDARTMRWMADQYKRLRRSSIAGAINGKPVEVGGIPGRPDATARGA